MNQDHPGVEIRQRREAALVTQRELAAVVGISQALVSKIERYGEVSKETLEAIDSALIGFEKTVRKRRRVICRRAIQKLSEVERRALGFDVEPPREEL